MLASILITPTNINFHYFSLIYVHDCLFLYGHIIVSFFCKLNLFIYSAIFCVSMKLFFFGTDVSWILLNIILFLPISLSLLWYLFSTIETFMIEYIYIGIMENRYCHPGCPNVGIDIFSKIGF